MEYVIINEIRGSLRMYSMTGYGRATAEADGRSVTIEMKSVNHRFLDISVKMPKTIIFAEETVKKVIGEHVFRGHFDVTVNYDNTRDDRYQIMVDHDLAKKYIQAINTIAADNGIENHCSAEYIAQMDDVIRTVPSDDDMDSILDLVKTAAQDAVTNLCAMRLAEGRNLCADVTFHLQNLEELRSQIEAIAPSVPIAFKERLENRLKELGAEADPARIAQEVAIMADKCAIDEELSRLQSHIGQMYAMMQLERENGKKMDFLTQELNRECNTIGSKASNVMITQCVVSAKNEVEKIREQVQNIE